MNVKATFPYSPNDPKRSNILVVGMGGQSNMDKFADSLQSQYSGHRGDIRIWDGDKFAALTTSNNSYPNAPAGKHAGEFARLYKLADLTSRTVFGVKHAVGSTSMKDNWQVGQATYEAHCDTITDALAAAPQDYDFNYLWCQGEGDASVQTDADAYGARYLTQINDFCTRFSPKVYVCILTQSDLGAGYDYATTVHAAQISAIASAVISNPDTKFVTVDVDDINTGSLHRDSDGYKTEGERGANALDLLVSGGGGG